MTLSLQNEIHRYLASVRMISCTYSIRMLPVGGIAKSTVLEAGCL